MTRLFLVRHGETAWNRVGRYQGCRDTGLSALGHRQAREAALRLAVVPLDAIYTSPLRRCRETAEEIASVRPCPVHVDDGLREICHGAWEGLTVAAVERTFPALWREWRERPDRVVMPQGEALRQVRSRVSRVVGRIGRRHPDGHVCVVTHGVTARVLIAWAVHRTLGDLWAIDSSPAGITEIHRSGRRWIVSRLNEVSHLSAPPRAHRAL